MIKVCQIYARSGRLAFCQEQAIFLSTLTLLLDWRNEIELVKHVWRRTKHSHFYTKTLQTLGTQPFFGVVGWSSGFLLFWYEQNIWEKMEPFYERRSPVFWYSRTEHVDKSEKLTHLAVRSVTKGQEHSEESTMEHVFKQSWYKSWLPSVS